jgi:hypothetical protein
MEPAPENKRAGPNDPAHLPNVLQRASDLPKLDSKLHTNDTRARACTPKSGDPGQPARDNHRGKEGA